MSPGLELSGALGISGEAVADEGLFGYVKGAEPLPKGSWDGEQWFTWRGGKEQGSYNALDTETEVEYGFVDRFSGSVAFFGLGINTSGLMIDAYLPGAKQYPWRPAGVEAAVKYNFLTPALDDFGLAQYTSLSYFWYDVNSGFRKNVYAFETFLIAQKYYLDGQLVVAANLGIEADSATRQPIQGLPADFEWPLTPEMEIAITASAGITYRVISNWFISAEIFYQTEHETVVGQERWSQQAGPTVHYAAKDWWVTLTWMPQLVGGGNPYPGQTYNQQVIEKTLQDPSQDRYQLLKDVVRPLLAFVLVPAALVAAAPGYAAEYLTGAQSQQVVFPEADRFVDAAVELSDDQRKAIEDKSGVRQRWKRQAVWRAEKAGQLVGWFIVDEVVGKREFITYAAGLTPDGKVRGIEILVYRETHGYQVRTPEWRHHFEGKTLSDPFKLEQDIPNIAGATPSCKNVINGVKRLLALQQVMLR